LRAFYSKKHLLHMPGIESDCSVSFSRRKSRTKCPRTDTKNWSPVGRGRTRRHQIRIKPSLKQWLMVTKSNTVITVLQVNNFFFLYFFLWLTFTETHQYISTSFSYHRIRVQFFHKRMSTYVRFT